MNFPFKKRIAGYFARRATATATAKHEAEQAKARLSAEQMAKLRSEMKDGIEQMRSLGFSVYAQTHSYVHPETKEVNGVGFYAVSSSGKIYSWSCHVKNGYAHKLEAV